MEHLYSLKYKHNNIGRFCWIVSTERNSLKFCMHERNMLWKTHAFLDFAIQSITTQSRFRPPDAGTGPGPLMKFSKL